MKIAVWAAQGDLEGSDATEGIGQRGVAARGHAGVRNHDSVAAQFFTVLFEKRGQTGAAHFFLALDHEGDVTGQWRPRLKISFDRFEVSQVLAFVIAGATAIECSSILPRLERWRFPQFKRFRRLDVVMSINHKVWPPRNRFPRARGSGYHD